MADTAAYLDVTMSDFRAGAIILLGVGSRRAMGAMTTRLYRQGVSAEARFDAAEYFHKTPLISRRRMHDELAARMEEAAA